MPRHSVLRQRRSKRAAAVAGGVRRLRAQNRKLLAWLDSWLATPDDRGEQWWKEFEADIKNHRVIFGAGQTE